MTTDPGDRLEPTQPFSLAELIDDDDEAVPHATADDEESAASPLPRDHSQ